jgi:hypothetical protein
MFWTFKLSFVKNSLAVFGLATVLGYLFQHLGIFFSKSSGHPDLNPQI